MLLQLLLTYCLSVICMGVRFKLVEAVKYFICRFLCCSIIMISIICSAKPHEGIPGAPDNPLEGNCQPVGQTGQEFQPNRDENSRILGSGRSQAFKVPQTAMQPPLVHRCVCALAKYTCGFFLSDDTSNMDVGLRSAL
jgi:hypothetical protein